MGDPLEVDPLRLLDRAHQDPLDGSVVMSGRVEGDAEPNVDDGGVRAVHDVQQLNPQGPRDGARGHVPIVALVVRSRRPPHPSDALIGRRSWGDDGPALADWPPSASARALGRRARLCAQRGWATTQVIRCSAPSGIIIDTFTLGAGSVHAVETGLSVAMCGVEVW